MRKRTAFLLLCGLLLFSLFAIAVWYLKKNQANEPAGNARFVQTPPAHREEKNMEDAARTALAAADVNGNAGAYAPEREIRYKPCARRESRGAQNNCGTQNCGDGKGA